MSARERYVFGIDGKSCPGFARRESIERLWRLSPQDEPVFGADEVIDLQSTTHHYQIMSLNVRMSQDCTRDG